MMVENPFRYGKVVSEPYFIDREEEYNEIKRNLISGQNLILYSPRRYGKTSLIHKVLQNLESEGYNTIYLDFFRAPSLQKFIEIYAAEILKKTSAWDKSISLFRKIIHGITPSVSFGTTGMPIFNFSFNQDVDQTETLIDVLNLPEKIDSSRRWIIGFDEFQEISQLNGDELEKAFRSVLQFHENISYIILGSKTHLLLNMFNKKQRAFYKFGKLIYLDKIPFNEMQAFIVNRFEQDHFTIYDGMSEDMLHLTKNIPYYVQFFASELWFLGMDNNRKIDHIVYNEAIDRMLLNQQDYFIQLYESLTAYQKSVLLAIAVENKNIFTNKYATTFGLSAISSTQRAVSRLIELGMLEKLPNGFEFTDPFFQRYIQLRILA